MTSIAVKEIYKLCPRDRVIAATLSLITSEGVDAVTHRRVAAIAGVSPGTTTHHFSSRAELLHESFMAYLEQLDDAISQHIFDPKIPPMQAVHNALLNLIENEFNKIPMLRAEYELLLAASTNDKLAEAVKAWEARATKLIEDALEQAKVKSPDEAALILINFIRGFELERLYKPNLSVIDFNQRLGSLLNGLSRKRD
jgi:DNA-binding transcriptional regulator YbjK